MPNNYFQFKQFKVYQDQCAMKVCTDACLFGAYTADLIHEEKMACNTILDIGAGTGLLSLMLAQKTTALIDAVEIDKAAYDQASENIKRSPWKERLHVFNEDISLFSPGKKYDVIISNPPFFEGDLKSADANKNTAKHDTALTLQQLLSVVKVQLNEAGVFAVLLPYQRAAHCIETAEQIQLYCFQKTLAKQTAKHPYFRGLLFFSGQQKTMDEEIIIIKNEDGSYSDRFAFLLKDYYLHL